MWDLDTGRRCFTRPVLRLGATVAARGPWATVAWDTGRGRWFDPETGRTVERFEVPVHSGDVLAAGWADDAAAVFETAEGRQVVVEGGWFRFPSRPRPRPPAPREPGVAVGAEGLHVGGWRGALWPLPVEEACTVGDRVYGWSTDGLLVAVPT